jgi:hypothetical protein
VVRPPVEFSTPPPPRIERRPAQPSRREPPPAPPPAEPVVTQKPAELNTPPLSERQPAEPVRHESPPLAEPPPPVADPNNRQRRWERLEADRAGRVRPYEIALAVTLLVAVVGGLGVLWYQKVYLPRHPAIAEVVDESDGSQPSGDMPVVELGEKPRPSELFGIWELRSDDGRAGKLVLHPDGSLVAATVAEESPLPDYEGRWFLAAASGNQYVLEFGTDHHALDSYKVTIELTSPEAFTLVQTVKGGVPIQESHRFVRTGPAAAVGPKRPGATAQANVPGPGGGR